MKRLAMLAAFAALVLPVTAVATGDPARGEHEKTEKAVAHEKTGVHEKKAHFGSGLFVSVAEQVCKERLRPFLASDGAEKATRDGNRRCVKRLLHHEWKLARAVLVCTERLAETESFSRRALTECLVSVLVRRFGDEKHEGKDADKAKEAEEAKAEEEAREKEKAKQREAAAAEAEALAACKAEAADPGFAEEHEGMSFVEFYSEEDDPDERYAFKRCVQSKLEQ
jgi:hypothetical protein